MISNAFQEIPCFEPGGSVQQEHVRGRLNRAIDCGGPVMNHLDAPAVVFECRLVHIAEDQVTFGKENPAGCLLPPSLGFGLVRAAAFQTKPQSSTRAFLTA